MHMKFDLADPKDARYPLSLSETTLIIYQQISFCRQRISMHDSIKRAAICIELLINLLIHITIQLIRTMSMLTTKMSKRNQFNQIKDLKNNYEIRVTFRIFLSHKILLIAILHYSMKFKCWLCLNQIG